MSALAHTPLRAGFELQPERQATLRERLVHGTLPIRHAGGRTPSGCDAIAGPLAGTASARGFDHRQIAGSPAARLEPGTLKWMLLARHETK